MATVRTLYQNAGEAILDQAMATLGAAWGKEQPKAYGASVMVGLTAFVNAYHDDPNFQQERLVAKLQETNPVSLVATGHEFTPAGVTQAILFHYNRHLKSAQRALPPWDTLPASVRTYRFRTRRDGQS